jgi:hypothetical protein
MTDARPDHRPTPPASRRASTRPPSRAVRGAALAWLAATTLLGGCAPPTPAAPTVPVEPSAAPPAVPSPLVTAVGDFHWPEIRSACVLPGGRDLLYVVDPGVEGGTPMPAEVLRVYRAGLDERGWDGTSSTFADFGARYPIGSAHIEALACHPSTGQVIVSVAGPSRADMSVAADQWLLGPDGRPTADRAVARNAGPSLAWSPDGRRLLVEDGEGGGTVDSVDLVQGTTTRIPNAQLTTDIGAAAGGLYWAPDSRVALLVSTNSTPPAASDVLLWDADAPQAGPSGPYHLPGAEIQLVTPAGEVLYVVTDEVPESSPAPSRLFRWDVNRPAEAPVQVGRFTLPPAHYHLLGDPALLPDAAGAAAAGPRLVFTALTAGGRAAFLLDVGDGGPAGLWRLTPATEAVSGLQVAGDRLVYLYQPVRGGTVLPGPVDGAERMGVIPLAELARARLAGDARFTRVEP